MNEECAGRFRVALPEGWRLSARAHSIYGVAAWTAPTRETSASTQWESRLAAIRLLPPPKGAASSLRSELAFPGSAKAVWYHANPTLPSTLMLEAHRPVGDHVLWLKRTGMEGKEAPAEKLVEKLLSVYAPGTEAGFCIGAGSIRMEGSLSETAQLTMERIAGSGKLELVTQTVTAPDTETFMNLDEERNFARTSGSTLEVSMERERTLAGMSGFEMRVAISLPGEAPQLRYTWHFPGEPGQPGRPKMNLIGRAGVAAQGQLDLAWEAVLASLAAIPLNARP